ncbi:phasin family protein [Trinickia violacea]|uniref:Phasin family protein n=2 Tax=Trinickia violacea TaxID=2571746 RepID=A0A4V1EII5_9BURK|nr:phasin family protein [Trinickia violacea]
MMTLFTPEQFVAMQKANLEMAFGLARSLADAFEKTAVLNLQLTKSLLASSQASLLQGLTAPQTPETNAKQAELAASIPEQAQSYSRQLADIASATIAEFVRAGEGQADAYNRRVQTLVDDLAKNAPSGSEATIAAWKSAITTTSTLMETLRKSAQQAVHATESNLAAISGTANAGRGAAK